MERVKIPSNGLYQRGLATAIGTEDGDMFPTLNEQRKLRKHQAFFAHDADVLKIDKSFGHE